MPASNATSLHNSNFILLGLPGLEATYTWISIPFCLVYVLSLLGNCLLLVIIKTEPSLHEPMYLFLSMLSVNHLIVSSTILPKTLCIFWFKHQDIHIDVCLAQMYLVHSLTSMESGFLVAMAFDRYVAICNPLRHSAILNSRAITKVGVGVVLRGVVLVAPQPILLKSLPYCETAIFHIYCEFLALIKLSCGNFSAAATYSPMLVFVMAVVDIIFIILSYIFILHAVYKLPSKEARLKSLSTCGPHLCITIVAYSSGTFSFLIYQFKHTMPPYINVIVASFYLLSAPVLDPIIYGVKTKKIREAIFRVFFFRDFKLSHRGTHIVT